VIKLLLTDTRVNPSDEDNYAIQLASETGRFEVVKLLLEVGPSERFPKRERVNPSAYRNFAIRKASENGHLEIVKLLLNDSRVEAL